MEIEDILSEGVILTTELLHNWYGEYRTHISFDNRESWIIVEGYDTEEDAKIGHNKYKNIDTKELERLYNSN